MKQSHAVLLVPFFLPLTISACQKVAESTPASALNNDAAVSTSVNEFSVMHAAIAAGPVMDTEEYQ